MMQRGRTRSGLNPLGDLLARSLKEMGLEPKVRERQALAMWAEVVGPQIAAASTARDVRDGVLFVSCKSSAWSNELAFHKSEIVGRLNEAVGGEAIKDIRFSARGFTRKPGSQTQAGELNPENGIEWVAPTEEDEQAARRVAEQSGSEDLAERIRRAVVSGRRLSQQKRSEGWKTCPGCGSPYPGPQDACEHCLPR